MNTLTGLAKQTIQTKYRDHDTALSIQRQLLSIKANETDIYYTNVESEQTLKQESTTTNVARPSQPPMPEPATTAPETLATLPRQTESSLPSIAVAEDVPVKAQDIVVTIIAQKLKKSVGDISLASTIKTLVGGRRIDDIKEQMMYPRY